MKNRQKITHKQLKELGVIPWGCWRTVKRKIDGEGFPAYLDDGRYYFIVEEVEAWFKRRKVSTKAA